MTTKMNMREKNIGFTRCAYVVIGAAILVLMLAAPHRASATFQWPATSRPYVIGQAPVPNAGIRSHWDSVFTQPAWWKKRNQPQQMQPPWDTTTPGYVR